MTSSRWTPAALLPLLAAGYLALPASAADEPVRIGNTGALTGPYNEFGEGVRRGIVLAIDYWTEKGGVLGRKIELAHSLDDQLVPDRAVQNTRKIMDDP